MCTRTHTTAQSLKRIPLSTLAGDQTLKFAIHRTAPSSRESKHAHAFIAVRRPNASFEGIGTEDPSENAVTLAAHISP